MRYEVRKILDNNSYEVIFTTSSLDLAMSYLRQYLFKNSYEVKVFIYDTVYQGGYRWK